MKTQSEREYPVILSARLTPHRSLSRVGFVALMVFLGAITLSAATAFLIMGAWPICGFFAIELSAVFIAIRVNNRRARASEEIVVTSSELRVKRVSHRGQIVGWTLNPLWVQMDKEEHPEFGIERIYLRSRGRRLSVGNCLGADEKAGFAKELSLALQTAKRGPTYNPLG